jgi:hypothetical protein
MTWGKIDCSASHDHVHRRLGAAVENGAARRIVGNRGHATRHGDRQLALTSGKLLDECFEDPQGTHGVHIEDVAPGLVVNIACGVDEHVYRGVPLKRAATPEEIADTILFVACKVPSSLGSPLPSMVA